MMLASSYGAIPPSSLGMSARRYTDANGNPEAEFIDNFVIDHCHVTNTVRGLTCSPCNVAIGMLRDSPDRARKIAEYLENSVKPNVRGYMPETSHPSEGFSLDSLESF